MRIWEKPAGSLSARELHRSVALKEVLDARWRQGTAGCKALGFSAAVPHGEKTVRNETVMMTRIEGNGVFVHASDIQLLDDDTVDLVLEWQPDIRLAGGPPLYLEQPGSGQRSRAWQNAVRLAHSVDTLILDREGLQWLDRLSAESGRRVFCAADYMDMPHRLLEADRQTLYAEMPVPSTWHRDYAEGKAATRGFQKFVSCPG